MGGKGGEKGNGGDDNSADGGRNIRETVAFADKVEKRIEQGE